jgi:hypothetical protein
MGRTNPASFRPRTTSRRDDVRRSNGGPDLAFADTVVALDFEDAIPPSGIVVSDEAGGAHCLLPVAYPPPQAGTPSVAAPRSAWAKLRYRLRHTRDEMRLLWSATATIDGRCDVDGMVHGGRAPTLTRRLRTLLSFIEWHRADLIRAAWIGVLVFVLTATVGAIALQVGPPESPAETSSKAPSR